MATDKPMSEDTRSFEDSVPETIVERPTMADPTSPDRTNEAELWIQEQYIDKLMQKFGVIGPGESNPDTAPINWDRLEKLLLDSFEPDKRRPLRANNVLDAVYDIIGYQLTEQCESVEELV